MRNYRGKAYFNSKESRLSKHRLCAPSPGIGQPLCGSRQSGSGRMSLDKKTLVLYRRRALRKEVCTSAVLRGAFDKAVRRKPPAVAADAGRMQIQLREGAVWRCAEAVR